MLSKTLLAFAFLAGLAQAQFADLPTCGASCAQLSASKATGCTGSDLRCLCQNQDYVDAVYDCLAGACDFGDQSSSIGHLGQICAAAVSDPASSTPVSTSTSSAGAPSSSAAGAPVSSTTAPVAFTSTPGTGTSTATGTTTSAAAAGTTSSVTRALGTTTVPSSSHTTAGTSTTVVVRTVSDADATSTATGGGSLLNGNGAFSVKGGGMGMIAAVGIAVVSALVFV